MNKVYSRIWNASLGHFVVASELAPVQGRRHGARERRSAWVGKRAALAVAISLAMMTLSGLSVAAQPSTTEPADDKACTSAFYAGSFSMLRDNDTTCDDNLLASAMTVSQPGTVTPYYQAGGGDDSGGDNTAVGLGTEAGFWGSQSVAYGVYAQAPGDQSTALGSNSFALGSSSIVLGGDDFDQVANKSYTATINGTTMTKTGGELFQELTGSNAVRSGVYHSAAAGDGSIAIGVQAMAGAENAGDTTFDTDPELTSAFDIAIGAQAKSSGFSSVAIGTGAIATGDASFALGAAAQAEHNDALAFGSGAKALADSSFAMGHLARADELGTIAFGAEAEAGAERTIAFGYGAKATGDDAMAFGSDAVADGEKAIAIGPGSHATAAHDGTEVDFSTVGGYEGNIAGAIGSDAGVVSFGQDIVYRADVGAPDGIARDADGKPIVDDPGVQRQLQNVAPGRISDTSTDAVNGSQLNVTNQQVTQNTEALDSLHYLSVNSLETGTGSNEDNDGATGQNSIAIGPHAAASQTRDVAVGAGAVTGTVVGATRGQADNIAVGDAQALGGGSIAMGQGAKATGTNLDGNNNAVAIGPQAQVNDYNSMALGANASTGVGATYSTAIGSMAMVADGAYSAVAIGSSAAANASRSVAIGGSLATNPYDVALGYGSVTVAPSTGPYTVNGGTIAGNDHDHGVVSVGSGNLQRQIQNVAAGTVSADSTDAVNGSQLYAVGSSLNSLGDSVASALGGSSTYDSNTGTVTTSLDVDGTTYTDVDSALNAINTTAATGWNVADADGNSNNIGPDGTVTFSGDGNIDVTESGVDDAGQVAVTLNRDLDLDSVTTGNTVINTDGLTITGGPSITTVGIDAADTRVTNVADATDAGDAVNLGQMTSAAAAAASEVKAGTNVASVDQTTAADGHAVYTVNADGAAVVAGDGVDVTSAAGADNVTDYTVGLNQATKDSLADADSAMQSVETQVDGTTVKTLTKSDNTANFVSGKNIQLSDDGAGGIEVATTDDLEVASVTAGNTIINNSGLTITGGPSITTVGIDAADTRITNVADGTDPTDAINKSQLDAVNDAATAGWNVADADGNSNNIGPDGTVTFSGDGNIDVTESGVDNAGQVAVTLNRDLDLDSVTTGDSTLDTTGLTVNDTASGTLTSIGSGAIALADNSGDITTIDTTSIVVGGAHGVTLDGDAGTIGGLANTTFDPDSITSGQAATEDQLKQVSDVASAGWNVGANGTATPGQVKPGDSVDFSNTDHNIKIAQTDNGTDHGLTFDLADDLDVTSVTTGNTVMNGSGLTVDDGTGRTHYGAGGVVIAGGPAITVAGVDAGNLPVVNVADGVDVHDAVNVGQLDAATDGLKTAGMNFAGNQGADVHRDLGQTLAIQGGATTAGSYDAGNIRTVTDPATGAIQIQIADSPKFGNVTINVDGSGRITGVSRGVEATDAVNMEQLEEVAKVAGAGWNVSAQGAHASNVKPGDTVDFNNSDDNIVVSKAADSHDVTFDLADDITVDSISLGSDIRLDDMGLVIVGGPSITVNGIDAGGLRITNVAAGTDPTDAVNVSQLDAVADNVQKLADNAVQYDGDDKGQITLGGTTSTDGGKTGGTTITNVHRGEVSADSTDAVNGSQLYETNQKVADNSQSIRDLEKGQGGYFQVNDSDGKGKPQATGTNATAGGAGAVASAADSTALGSGAQADGDNSVALGAGSVAERDNVVSVGSAAQARQVTHVAAGTEDTDAVNVAQLNKGMEKVTNWARSYTDQRFQTINQDLNRLGRRANAGIASAVAMASLPQAYDPNQSAASVSLGNYHGETAIAVGLSTITDSGRYVFKLNASSNTRGDSSVGVGAAIVW